MRTYIKCVNLKNDLSIKLCSYSHEEYSKYYLTTLFRSYIALVDTYFPNLKNNFNPKIGKKTDVCIDKKACIVGQLSKDKKQLTYWFDWKSIDEEDVQLIENSFREAYEDMEHRAIIERRNISTYGVNLELSGYGVDSARTVAIKRIKGDIDNILKKRVLIDDDFLLCERLAHIKKDLKLIRESSSIEDMYLKVKNYVDAVFEKYEEREGELVGIVNGKVDMIELLEILEILYKHAAVYETLLEPDIKLTGGFIWDFYSREQILKVVEKFFSQVIISFNKVVELNFPLMQKYFHMSQDYPMRYRVRIRFREGEGYASEPGITYYYVSTEEDKLNPEIITEEVDRDEENIFDEIYSSYLRNGKEIKNATITDTGFMMCIGEGGTGFRDSPVGAFVYKQMEEEFEELFDK